MTELVIATAVALAFGVLVLAWVASGSWFSSRSASGPAARRADDPTSPL